MRWFWLLLLGTAALWAFTTWLMPGSEARGKIKLTVWGMPLADDNKGFAAQIAEFERRNPDIDVTVLSMGAGAMNPQKLLTAIIGKAPPDMLLQDRFTIGDWASRGAFMPLDELIAKDSAAPDGIRKTEFYPACWNEAVYHGKVYAIPAGTDDRVLFWNRELFRKAAPKLRKMGLDPNRAPRTWSELKKYAVALTEKRPGGGYARVGFLPNFGNSWLYLYSWQMNGELMSADGKRCTLANPRTEAALQYMVDIYDALGGMEALSKFQSGFFSEAQDPFFLGKVAMKVDGNWFIGNIAKYRPTMDFGVAPPPIPDERYEQRGIFKNDKDKFITWMGGFSYAIPVGSKHQAAAWHFIKWMVSPASALVEARAQGAYLAEQGHIYLPSYRANWLATEALYQATLTDSPTLNHAMRKAIDLLPNARYRPVTFVGQTLWDEQVRAFEQAVYHKQSPRAALTAGQALVQRELDRMAERESLPTVHPLAIWGFVAAGALGVLSVVGFLWRRVRGLPRMARGEASAGYLFISPWVLGFLIFTAGPILASLFLSLCDYDVMHPARWVGLGNYQQLFTSDWANFGKAASNIAYLAVIGVPLNLATGLAIALLLNSAVRGMQFYRTAFYIPAIAPIIASAVLWAWVLNADPDRGLLNAALATFWPGAPPGWLMSETWSKPALIVMGLWGAGGGMVLWLAGLQGIPRQLYEAARIDGAGPWPQFRNITLPQLTPYIFFNVVMGFIGSLQEFDRIYVMRPGDQVGIGPVDSLLVPVYYLFQNAFQYFRMGYASAIAWVLFAVILALTVIQLKLAPRWVYYESGQAKD